MNEGAVILSGEGSPVNQKMMYLAEMIGDYNPQLELLWIPPDKREPQDRNNCYVVVHRDRMGKQYVVLYASESDTPETIMTRLISSDMKHGNVMDRMDVRNNVNKLFAMRELEEDLAQEEDLATFLVKTNKVRPTYRHPKTGEKVTLDSQLNRVQTRKSII